MDEEPTNQPEAASSAERSDAWYASLEGSRALSLMSEGYPHGVFTTGVVPFEGVMELAALLARSRPRTLADLGSGLGSPGLLAARHSGAELIGIERSVRAVASARHLAAERFSGVTATFLCEDATATSLGPESVDAAMSVDVIQLVDDRAAFLGEALRILRPGGLLAITTWETDRTGPDRIPRDVGAECETTGFEVVERRDHPEWLARWDRIHRRALEAVTSAPDDQGLLTLVREGDEVAASERLARRVLVVARRPASRA